MGWKKRRQDGRNRSRPVKYPFSDLPQLAAIQHKTPCPPPPDDEGCFALWRKYGMFANVMEHSLKVAAIATALARRARELDMPVSVDAVRASALLHDLAKSYCVLHGGSHATLGASWVIGETRNYDVAQGVILHVHWPWKLPEGDAICSLPLFVLYADKRVRHDQCVSLGERYADLLKRYGHTQAAREWINQSHRQAKRVEKRLSEQLGWKIDEDSFDCGRLVK